MEQEEFEVAIATKMEQFVCSLSDDEDVRALIREYVIENFDELFKGANNFFLQLIICFITPFNYKIVSFVSDFFESALYSALDELDGIDRWTSENDTT